MGAVIKKVTYSERYRRATVYTSGCNFRCIGCSYKLNNTSSAGNPLGEIASSLTSEEVINALKKLDLKRVHFVGGEPTLCPDIGAIAEFCHEELGVRTKIGHSTGWNLPPEHIDEMNVTIKAYSSDLHKKYTGFSNRRVLNNFKKIYNMGVVLSASTVFIPGLIDADEIEMIARFISDVDPAIPLHITGYVPVPDTPWRAPTQSEMAGAEDLARQYLENVTTSWFKSAEDYMDKVRQDPRYQSIQVL